MLRITSFVLLVLIVSSCGKSDKEKAQDSLIGDWEVTAAYYQDPITSEQESMEGDLGMFSFSSSSIDYSYTIANTKSKSEGYTFSKTKENAGFIQVNVYTVELEDESFRVRFGDETSDAHCDATEISLEQFTIGQDDTVLSTVLALEKQ